MCLVYDCLYPWTIGGAERWYRALAERLTDDGHEVTYLTMRQWEAGDKPRLPGVRVVAVGPRAPLYTGDRRRIGPPISFGAGVLAHLARHGRGYDVVHCASFPYFPLLAAGAVRPLAGYALVADWWEVWSDDYWRGYLGQVGGRIGSLVQRACATIPHRARTASDLHARRLAEVGHRGPIAISTAAWPVPVGDGDVGAMAAGPTIVYVGRHITDKRVEAIPPALAVARQRLPNLRARIFGGGPTTNRLLAAARAAGVEEAIDLPGFAPETELDAAIREALCLVLPSRREGLGLAVLDAASRGVPAVVVRGPDNAATESIIHGINGAIAASAAPSHLAAAICEVAAGGDALRATTREWWHANRARFSAEAGVAAVVATYRDALGDAGARGRP